MIFAANVPREFENRTKVAVLDGLILHVAMDYEDDFDSINSQTVTLQFSAKHVDMDMEQSTQPILHIYFLTQLLFGCRTESAAKFISLMPEKFDLTRHSSKVHGVTVNGVYLTVSQQQLPHQHHRPLKCQVARTLYLVWQPLLDQGCPFCTLSPAERRR